MYTKEQALSWINSVVGKTAFEDGGASGTQCVELTSTYAGVLMGVNVTPSQCGNGKDCATNLPKNFPKYFKAITDLTDVQAGDVLSHWSTSAIQQGKNLYGHTSVVKSVDGSNYTLIEQWAGSGTVRTNTKSKTLKSPTHYAIIGIARPIYAASASSTSASTASATVTAESMPTLRKGAKNDAVKTLQTKLNANGAKLTVDGAFGSLTDSAVRVFQKAKGLSVDGIVGAKTWAALLANS